MKYAKFIITRLRPIKGSPGKSLIVDVGETTEALEALALIIEELKQPGTIQIKRSATT